jgi:hypothetical protein
MAQMNSVAKARPRWGKFAAIFTYFTLFAPPILWLKNLSRRTLHPGAREFSLTKNSRIFTSTHA